jgi:DNA-directed RNA polymerase specialized sigma24 family protein
LKKRAAEQATTELPEHRDPRRTSIIAGARVDLLDALEQLELRAPDRVAPFVLRDISDLEYDEIADQLGLPVSTIRYRIHEARKFIRQRLASR